MTYIYAFLCGGAICAIAQILIDKTKLTPGRILVSFVVLGVVLSGIGVYEPFAEFAGAGASVPIIGFGHLLAQGVKDAVDTGGVMGILRGGFEGAAAGLCAVIIFSLVAAVFFKGKRK
ncbi:MAG: stage V sporulation protein AE [Ruminococcaceae bacterium]|nr:stage V sporulation protein AE [Oscillospiraceae bacterium]